jgi:hypothetical protein
MRWNFRVRTQYSGSCGAMPVGRHPCANCAIIVAVTQALEGGACFKGTPPTLSVATRCHRGCLYRQGTNAPQHLVLARTKEPVLTMSSTRTEVRAKLALIRAISPPTACTSCLSIMEFLVFSQSSYHLEACLWSAEHRSLPIMKGTSTAMCLLFRLLLWFTRNLFTW